MAKYARVVGDVAVDVSTNPGAEFHPTIAAQFVAVPNVVQRGWHLVDGTWTAPAPSEPAPAPAYPKVDAITFKLLFSPAERVALSAAKETDLVIADWFSIVDDPRLANVDLALQSTQDGLAYLVAQGILTTERRAQILSGQLQ